MRRYASVWAVGHAATKAMPFRVPRVLNHLKATASSPPGGEESHAPGGVFDHGTPEEDDPGTWEALVFPREATGVAESR